MKDRERWMGEEQACAGTRVLHVRTRARRTLKRSARERVEEVRGIAKRNGKPFGHSHSYKQPSSRRDAFTISALDQVRNYEYSHRAIQLRPPTQGTAL